METIRATERDIEALLRYHELKGQSRLLYAEIDAITEYLNRRTSSPEAWFLAPDGTELAKKAPVASRELDRDALVEAGIAIEEFYAASSKSRLTTTKALAALASHPEPNKAARGVAMR